MDKIQRLESDLQVMREDMAVLAQLAMVMAQHLSFETYFRECVHDNMAYVCIKIPNRIAGQLESFSEVQYPIPKDMLLLPGAQVLHANLKEHFISEFTDLTTEKELESERRTQQIELIKHFIHVPHRKGTINPMILP